MGKGMEKKTTTKNPNIHITITFATEVNTKHTDHSDHTGNWAPRLNLDIEC